MLNIPAKIEVMSRIWDLNLHPTRKLVLLVLANSLDERSGHGRTSPSISAIARRASISRSQVQRILHGLIDAGVVSVVGNPYGGAPSATRQYQLHLDRIDELTKTGNVEATESAPARNASHGRTAGVAPARRKAATREQHADRSDVTVLPDWENDLDLIEQQARLLGLIVDPEQTWGELTARIRELARCEKAASPRAARTRTL